MMFCGDDLLCGLSLFFKLAARHITVPPAAIDFSSGFFVCLSAWKIAQSAPTGRQATAAPVEGDVLLPSQTQGGLFAHR
jgi:hypothetical protein